MICQCGKEFTPKRPNQKVCDRECHTRRLQAIKKEETKRNNDRAKRTYKRLKFPNDKFSKIKVPLREFLNNNERMSTTRAFLQLDKPLDTIKNDTGRIKIAIASSDDLIFIIRQREDKYLATANMGNLNSVRYYEKIRIKLYKYAKELHNK